MLRYVAAVFVRVVHRVGWDVEVVREDGSVETENLPERDAALEHAKLLEPEWIELGEVVRQTDEAPQHHRWKTLRRLPGGEYAESGLNWGGRG